MARIFMLKFTKEYTSGLLTGAGGGLVLAKVLFKHWSVAEIGDTVLLAGYALWIIGIFVRSRVKRPFSEH